MLRFRTDMLRHLQGVRRCVARYEARAHIDLEGLRLYIRHRGQALVLYPQFVARLASGAMAYAPALDENTVGFVGWYPYPMKTWPLAQDKLAFKCYVESVSLRTPCWTLDAEAIAWPFIVKAARSSFGRGLRGPFTPEQRSSEAAKLAPGEYYEALCLGEIARIWYWNEEPIAAEIFPMPTVRGDGRHTLAELTAAAVGRDAPIPTVLPQMARLAGLDPDEVIAQDHEVTADYRYVSPLNPSAYKNFNVLRGMPAAQLAALRKIGRELWQAIPAPIRAGTLMVVDAIQDERDDFLLLEVDCNPQIHPDCYGPMLSNFLSEAEHA